MATINSLIKSLRNAPTKCVFNPWYDVDPANDHSSKAPSQRRANLLEYLARRQSKASWLLIAEAAGFRGAKFSGIAMTCERQLTTQNLPHTRTSHPELPLSKTDQIGGVLEPTAMIVARAIEKAAGDPAEIVLWNTFAWHPHQIDAPLTNRTPKPPEVTHGLPALREMISLFPKARIIAIGKTAQRTLFETLKIEAPAVRHPANGGATLFTDGIVSLLK